LLRRLLVLALVPVTLVSGCGGGGADPESARCTSPNATFGDASDLGTHREVAVHFTCEETALAGTLYLPNGSGRPPAVVWVHGSGEQPRLNYGPVVAPLVEDGVAVFSYDKRGVGESEGACCTSPGEYDLVAADADGAVNAVRSHPEIDPNKVGLYGASEAGWVVPLADSRLAKPVAFTALVDGPAVTTGEEEVWSDAAGEEDEGPLTAEKKAEATQKLQEAGPSGFDPAPLIEQMSTPGLWLYGGADKSIPTGRSVEILTRMKQAGKDFTIVVFPNAGHGLVDNVPTAPEAPATLVDWIKKTAAEG
jgi:pimeloyl-ACP methyl ester carboxylesterase